MASDLVRVLGVTMTSDLSLDKHVANVCATCFYWFRQLRRVRRSLDAESAATLVHAFVKSRVDYCNAILAGVSTYITDKRVMNAAARVISDSRKYGRALTNLLHDKLHWLDVPERVQYKLCATVHRCLQHKAPQYMIDCCVYASDPAAWNSLPDYLRDSTRSVDSFRRDLTRFMVNKVIQNSLFLILL